MRIRNMKNVWKRIGTFVLAFIMTVPVIGGWSVAVGAIVNKFKGSDYFELEVVQLEGGVEEPITNDTLSLEKGDKLRLKVKTVQQIDGMKYFKGSLVFTAWDARGQKEVDIGDCFEDIHLYDYVSYFDEVKLDKADRYHEFMLTSTNDLNGTDIEAGAAFLKIDLKVKRAVDKDVYIKFQGADPETENCFELKKIGYDADYFTPIVKKVTNKWYDQRKLSFTVAGNSERTDDSAIDVPVKATKTKKTRIAVRINKDNGTDKGTDALGYAGFILSYTYNPEYLSLDTDGGKEIYYELSDKVKNNGVKVDGFSIIQPPKNNVYAVNEGDRRRITVSFISESGEDIRVYGDFLYLTFVPANGSQKLGLADVDANVEVTLMGGVNSAETTMKTEVSSGTGYSGTDYLDPEKDVCGGTRTFRVNFVKSLIRFGDVNNDTYINLIDALMVLQHYNDSDKYPLTDEQKERANTNDSVDGNGKPTIDPMDVLFIIQYVNGERSELPVITKNN